MNCKDKDKVRLKSLRTSKCCSYNNSNSSSINSSNRVTAIAITIEYSQFCGKARDFENITSKH